MCIVPTPNRLCFQNRENAVCYRRLTETDEIRGAEKAARKTYSYTVTETQRLRNEEARRLRNVLTMYLFFDTETTGLPRSWKAPVTDLDNWPRLVQIAWLAYDEGGVETGAGNFIVKPEGFIIPEDSARIHGITNARALAEGEEISSVLGKFKDAMNVASTLVAHNMSFDEKIVGAEFLRSQIDSKLDTIDKICTMEGTKEFCGLKGQYGLKWAKLSELHQKLFGTDFTEAHNAANDIKATARCFWELKKLGVL